MVSGETSGSVSASTAATYVFDGPMVTNAVLGIDSEHFDMDGDGIEDLLLRAFEHVYVVAGGGAPGTYQLPAVAEATIGIGEGAPTSGEAITRAWSPSTTMTTRGQQPVRAGDYFAYSGALQGAVTLPGPFSGSVTSGDADATWIGGRIGYWIATGDCNGDKAKDVILGGVDEHTYLSLGPASGTIDVADVLSFSIPDRRHVRRRHRVHPRLDGGRRDGIAIGGIDVTTTAGGVGAGAIYVTFRTLLLSRGPAGPRTRPSSFGT